MQTFLFTDIEGSTRLWERFPAEMGPAIARHEQILRDAIGVRGGTVFNTAGDSVCAVFPGADRAIAAALDAQRTLQQEPWETFAPGLRIAVRMALDAGDAEASGGNFVGPVLNRLHRLMKTGHGGQILCTAGIAPDDLGADLRLRDLGSHPLRDIAGETHLFQILAPGLPATFPPLVTERPLPRSLPLPPITLFGRARELDEIDTLIRERNTRLVTLLGPGGVGKTSLALALGRQLFDAFPDGVHFIDLSALREGALVVPTIAGALEVDDPLLTQEDALIARLRQQSLLLILDNCEQVVDAVADVTRRLVGETASVSVLSTSRVPLRLRGEHEARIEPFPTPTPREDPASNPAVQLFDEQARHVNNRFTLNRSTQPEVVEICRLLDGLPLAIELAAAWVRILDPATLRNRLSEGAPLLKSDTRDRPERHRTLTSTIDWSYQLLSPEAQLAFGRLALFEGGIPFDGALAVLQDGEPASFVEALELIDTLVQANLVQAPSQTADGPRYLMLQTIQEFGRTVLSSEESIAAHRAHAGYFASMASAAEEHYRSPEAASWLDRLDANIDNLRAAVQWLALDVEGDAEQALHLAMGLWEYFDVRGRHLEARELVAVSLEHAIAAPPLLRSRALAILGHTWLSNYEQAETYYRRSIDLQSSIPGSDPPHGAVFGVCTLAQVRGDYATAIELAEQMLALAKSSGDLASLADWLLMLGQLKAESRQFAEAAVLLEESLAVSEQAGSSFFACWVWRILGEMYLWQDDLAQAEPLFSRALADFEAMGDPLVTAQCRLNMAWIAVRQSNPANALALLETAVTEIALHGNPFLTHEALSAGAMVLIAAKADTATGLALLASADHWRASTGSVLNPLRSPWVDELAEQAKQSIANSLPNSEAAREAPHTLRDAIDLLLEVLRRILHSSTDSVAELDEIHAGNTAASIS